MKRASHWRPAVALFCRPPRYGGVKTRLAAGIGPARALAFYRVSAAGVIRALAGDPAFGTILVHTGSCDHAPAGSLHGLQPRGLEMRAQGSGDLGERMARWLRRAEAYSGARPHLVIGSDVPAIDARAIREALRALRSADLVLGPSRDGGYWLIGWRGAVYRSGRFPGLRHVRWSTAHALTDTLACFPSRVRIKQIRQLDDVDDLESYRRWLRNRSGGGDG